MPVLSKIDVGATAMNGGIHRLALHNLESAQIAPGQRFWGADLICVRGPQPCARLARGSLGRIELTGTFAAVRKDGHPGKTAPHDLLLEPERLTGLVFKG